jgi:microcompartment protein CcmK/EutM
MLIVSLKIIGIIIFTSKYLSELNFDKLLLLQTLDIVESNSLFDKQAISDS